MYILVRTAHLISGLILAVGLFTYALTAFVIFHQDWFPGSDSQVTTRELVSTVAVSMSTNLTPEEADDRQQQLAGELGLRGRPNKRSQGDDGSWTFEYIRPGTKETIHLRGGRQEVSLTVEAGGFAHIMNRLHHFHGYDGGPRFFLWGLFVDLVGVAMILFSLSGIYLWYKVKRDHRLGLLLLGGSTAYGVGSVLFLVLGR